MNIEKVIKQNETELKQNIEEYLTLKVFEEETKNIIDKNKLKILNYFKFKNDFKIKHKNTHLDLTEEPYHILEVGHSHELNDSDFKIYWDLQRVFNLKEGLYTSNIEFCPNLVLNSEKIKREWNILNIFFLKDKYIDRDWETFYI